MIDETKEKGDVKTYYFDKEESYREQIGNPVHNNGDEIQLPTLRELQETQKNDSACTEAALTIGLSKYMLTFDMGGALARILSIDSASYLYITTTL